MKEILGTGQSTKSYYQSYNSVYEEAFGGPMMLHYPYYLKKGESFGQRQTNLTEFAFSFVKDWRNKAVLEVGCGNGVQCLYLAEHYPVSSVTGIDLNAENLDIAIKLGKNYPNVNFKVDNAHDLATIGDQSMDIVICIESAFHYFDKQAFLNQVRRVLRPGGCFVIADILNKRKKSFVAMRRWGLSMSLYHWTAREYLEGIGKAQLKLLAYMDISKPVIKGFRGYRHWIERKNFTNLSRYRRMKLFAIVECEAQSMILKVRRRYFVFSGLVEAQ